MRDSAGLFKLKRDIFEDISARASSMVGSEDRTSDGTQPTVAAAIRGVLNVIMAYSEFHTGDFDLQPAAFDTDGTPLYEGEYSGLLQTIIKRNDMEKLKQYVLRSTKRFMSDPVDVTWCDPFWMAASYGSTDACRFLLEQYNATQADKMPLNQRGFSLLHTACRTANVDVARFFLDSQPPLGTISARDEGNETPILSAASSLVNLNFVDADDGNPDDRVDIYKWSIGCMSRGEELVNLLLDRGACAQDSRFPVWNNDDDMKSQPLETVLGMAISRGSYALVKRLLDQGADPYIKHHFYRHIVIRFGNHDSFKDVNVLHMAALYWNVEGIKALIDHHTNSFTDLVFSHDSEGHFPLHYASVTQSFNECTRPDISSRFVDTFRLLLSGNPGAINARDEQGLTPLYYTVKIHTHCVGSRHSELAVRVLLEHGADATISDSSGRTILHLLAKSPWPIDTVLLDLLIAHGADVNHADNDGNRPLHDMAMYLHQTQAVSFLCGKGADISATNAHGDTAFHKVAKGIMTAHMSLNERKYEPLTSVEKILAQDEMMDVLQTAFGGDEMMNQPNNAGKTPRDLQTETRSKWQAPIKAALCGRGRGYRFTT
ncbi:hypothetical protein PISL3812_03858 [Talaromyces islandicus]|uniref:Uncharacterized protein n=1 Tax=Talaromyces islandicus TaxID=28573 RepID=A0A0U1LVM4_TALIS|nr:hypothetical protein PISL3812_03858 [Talaromyces islandicus]